VITADASVELSVVVPVYACADCLESLVARITHSVKTITSSYEIILVDDRSPDNAWRAITELAERDSHIRGFRLSRNFGQHAALTAAFAQSRGQWAVALDCDLQDPPEHIPTLYAKAQEGYDIVLARRVRKGHSLWRRAAAATYFKLLRTFTNADLRGEHGTFSIVSRPVVDAFRRVGDRSRHYMFIIAWLGFRRGEIEIEHGERPSGVSSYTFRRLMRHAIDGVFFQTTVLLRWIVYLGFVVSTVGVGLALYLIYFAAVSHPYPGWTSLAVLILVIGGFIIISTGVAGLYIGQIFEQVKQRPLYVIADEIGTTSAGMRSRETVRPRR
jgi:glycosyltransferase involved in cell wall biosynthesis